MLSIFILDDQFSLRRLQLWEELFVKINKVHHTDSRSTRHRKRNTKRIHSNNRDTDVINRRCFCTNVSTFFVSTLEENNGKLCGRLMWYVGQ